MSEHSPAEESSHEPRSRAAVVILGAFLVFYAILTISTWGWTYWDFGDGNYLYIAGRVNEGTVLYRDILAPQPPLHTMLGAAALRVGDLVFPHPLYGVRAYNLLVRLAQIVLLFLLADRLFRCRARALAGALIFAFLPIGFWWSLGYQSENIENVFLLLALWQLLRWDARGALLAGIASGLAMHCNMTAVPYFLENLLFLAFRRPRMILQYALGAIGVWGAGAGLAYFLSDGYYWGNVIANQVGTFPRTDILASMEGGPQSFREYATGKIIREGGKVLELEGGLILAALTGLGLTLGRTKPWHEVDRADEAAVRQRLSLEFLAWTAVGMALSICFVMKGGTVNYIFVLGEPAVALFAADALVRLGRALLPDRAQWRALSLFNTQAFLRALAFAAILLLLWVTPVRNILATFREQQAELPEAEVLQLRAVIQDYANPGDVILAPPFYAFLSDTRVAGELAENYIWQIKYGNERFDLERHGKEPRDGMAKMAEVAGMLERREVAFVLLDLNQTGRVPEIQAALQRQYQPLTAEPIRTRNVSLGLYIRRGVEVKPLPWVE